MKHHRPAIVTILAMLVAGCQGQSGTADLAPETVQGNPDRADSEARQLEWFTRKGTCLTEAGFPAEMDGDVLVVSGAVGREGDYEAASKACEAQLGEIPGSDPLTAEELGVLYDLHLEAADCLREHDLPVTAQMPSRDTWVAQEIKATTDSSVEPPPLPYDGLFESQYEYVCPYPSGEHIFNRMNAIDR